MEWRELTNIGCQICMKFINISPSLWVLRSQYSWWSVYCKVLRRIQIGMNSDFNYSRPLRENHSLSVYCNFFFCKMEEYYVYHKVFRRIKNHSHGQSTYV